MNGGKKIKKLFVLFAAVALVAAFTLPAAAADPAAWNFYGSSRMTTFYTNPNDDAGGTDNTVWDLQGNARIGAHVKAGDITGRFEYGSGPNLRILWGEYDFGGGQLGIGQHYTPIAVFDSNQVFGSDEDLLSWGGMYMGRTPMAQYRTGGLKIALVKNSGASDLGTGGGVKDVLPRLEASYNLPVGEGRILFMGGINTFNVDPDGVDESVTGGMLGASASFPVGPITLAGNLWIGRNVGTFGMYHQTADDPVINPIDGSLEDTDSWGGILVANFKSTDMLSFELGVGYTESDNDTFLGKDDAIAYYGNAVVTIAPGFFIVPEIGVQDNMDNALGLKEGKTWYAGAKWQINF
jgi:hypothetical protein